MTLRHLARSGALAALALLLAFLPAPVAPVFPQDADGAPDNARPRGYYQQPAIHGNTLVFVSEGDLWKVPASGGVAIRMTTHDGNESTPRISPDGKTLAFRAQYEGPSEVYTMPIRGGMPVRRTWDGASPVTWWPDGRLCIATRAYSMLPDWNLALLDLETGAREVLPLAQAADAAFFPDTNTLIFTRPSGQGSHTRQYRGGTAPKLWRYDLTPSDDPDAAVHEAVPLTADYAGSSRDPLAWNGRVYFASDRSGRMNLWSMKPDGSDLQQHTKHVKWALRQPALDAVNGRIVYQHGADLRAFDLRSGHNRVLDISIYSDFDQLREQWVSDPMRWLTSVHVSPDGDRVVLTARGEVFVACAPGKPGRLIHITRRPDVRYRHAQFCADGEHLVVLSDESGEVELWKLSASDAVDPQVREQLTDDGQVLRWDSVSSADGRWIAHDDKHRELFLYNTETKENQRIATVDAMTDGIGLFTFSPDSRWLAYNADAENDHGVIRIYDTQTGETHAVTTDRYNDFHPAWSGDGKWLYFISERHFSSSVGSPWGLRAPEPQFEKTAKIYAIALQPGLRSPFLADDEVSREEAERKKKEEEERKKREQEEKERQQREQEQNGQSGDETGNGAQPGDNNGDNNGNAGGNGNNRGGNGNQAKPDEKKPKPVEIDFDGIETRIYEVPVSPGNYRNLIATDKRLYFRDGGNLMMLAVTSDDPKAKVHIDGVSHYELSLDGKQLMVRKGNSVHIMPANGNANTRDKVDLGGWTFPLDTREEYRQMFREAWRLERDYFYDRNMHGVDWPAMYARYEPLVDRVSDRGELSDVIAQMVAELAALHTYVWGGVQQRSPDDNVQTGALGAQLECQADGGLWKITKIYRNDPDQPELRSPLAEPHLGIVEGDCIYAVNGAAVQSVPDIAVLLRNTIGQQVRLGILPAAELEKERAEEGYQAQPRSVIVKPISQRAESNLRYHEWEYTRRLETEEKGDGDIGYIHLRAMGRGDIADFVRQYYPVHHKKGLIVDVRHNGGGNIDSWILSRLQRKAWFFWQPRVGHPYWNMHYAFRGHMVVICNERTGSDGEAFTEGFRRLGLGKVIGTRTWGGEVWLSMNNHLVDRGIATASEIGVFGPEGEWLIEGHGVDPDIVVDNLPRATFDGRDAQLDAAILHLQEKIRAEPIPTPVAPAYPDKSQPDNRRED